MTYKQIEASREARLWIGQIIVPAISNSCYNIGHSRSASGCSNKG